MRVAIDGIPLLSPLTGVGHYVHQLSRQFIRLASDYDVVYYYGYFSKKLLGPENYTYELKNFLSKFHVCKPALRVARRVLAPLHWGKFDLYFEPNFIPLGIRAKKLVTTVHDFSFLLHPESHPQDRIKNFARHFLKDIKRSDRIITVSAYTKTEAVEFLGIPLERITPVHLGVDHDVFRPRKREFVDQRKRELGLPEKFILSVGTKEPRKNLDRLLRAYLELPEWMKGEFKIVLVGPKGWGEGISRDALKKLRDRIVVIDYVSVDTLACIYSMASLFVFPSLYEGFGLPPLEAMACGCPVVVSNAASLPEICGDAVFYIDPTDVSRMAEGMAKVLNDSELRDRLISRGLERAKLFSWEETAKKTLGIFSEVLKTA